MPDIKSLVLRSGPCFDSPAALRLYLAGLESPLLRPLLIALRIKFTPRVLENIRASALPPAEKSSLFSAAMTLFRSGPSFKTTAAGRSPLTDRAIQALLKPGMTVLETGVSDGISALPLMQNAAGASVLLSDRQTHFTRSAGRPFRFYDAEEGLLSVKLPGFYFCTGLKAAPPAGAVRIPLLNPALEARPGAELLAFDIFTGSLPFKPDVIKCANVLNSAYFGRGRLKAAVANLLANLPEGGWLFIAQNHPRYAGGEAYVALRREGGLLAVRGGENGHELLGALRSPDFAALVRVD